MPMIEGIIDKKNYKNPELVRKLDGLHIILCMRRKQITCDGDDIC